MRADLQQATNLKKRLKERMQMEESMVIQIRHLDQMMTLQEQKL